MPQNTANIGGIMVNTDRRGTLNLITPQGDLTMNALGSFTINRISNPVILLCAANIVVNNNKNISIGTSVLSSYSGNLSIQSANIALTGNVNIAGNINVTGAIQPSSWRPGQVISMVALSNSEVTVNTRNISSNNYSNAVVWTYTPVSASSYLVISCQGQFNVSGNNSDTWYSRIAVDNSTIKELKTTYTNDNDSSNRNPSLLPITGRYTNTTTATKNMSIGIKRGSSNDKFIMSNDNSVLISVTEIAR